MTKKKMSDKLFPYGCRRKNKIVENKVLNPFIDAGVNMIRGICSIIDGLVLLFTFGHFFTSLSFKAVMWIGRMKK
jgi:ABC-type methionine transport system permease subunit